MINKEQLDFLNRQSREDLDILLQKAFAELKPIESLQEKIAQLTQSVQNLRYKLDTDYNEKKITEYIWFCWVCIIITFGITVVLMSEGSESFVFSGTILGFLIFGLRRYLMQKKMISRIKQAVLNKLDEIDRCKKNFDNKTLNAEFLPLLPESYCYTLAVETMIKILNGGAVDTWKELAREYNAEYRHLQSTENSRKILESQERLGEYMDQKLQEQRRTTNWAALAAIGLLLRR